MHVTETQTEGLLRKELREVMDGKARIYSNGWLDGRSGLGWGGEAGLGVPEDRQKGEEGREGRQSRWR